MVEGQNLNKFILGVILVGITLVLGIFVAATIQTSFLVANTGGTAINESVTSSTTTGLSATLASASLIDGSCGTITAVYNGTVDKTPIAVANFTQTGCTVVNASTMEPWHTSLNFNYPYSYSSDTVSSNASGTLVTALNGGSAWITILVVVGFAVIVLGMLTSGLGRAGSGSSQGTEPGYTY